ncbi:MAG: hypothetical protein ABF321_01480 [Bacteroidia bacterium]
MDFSGIVFWLIILTVIVSTTHRLGIDVLTTQVQEVIDFIPDLLTASTIIIIGYLIAPKIKEVLTSLGSNAGRVLANVLYYFIMIMVMITAIDQLGIDTNLISKNILIIVGVILLAGGVAYRYAAREIIRNMLYSLMVNQFL